MEDSLIGAIAAGVICGILFIITVAVVCYLCYRCRVYEDEKSSQQGLLVNGHVSNGSIPTVTSLVPTPVPRHVYQFPSLPARHMASYRPRYMLERNPGGTDEGQGQVMKSQTYNGPYAAPMGPVVYDVRQHGGYRSNRSPIWAERNEEEAVATMDLGNESPRGSERHYVLEGYHQRASTKSNRDHKKVEKRSSHGSSRVEDIRIPTPDAKRKSYLFESEPDPEADLSKSYSATENTHDIYTITRESTNENGEVEIQKSRRQRRGEDGAIGDILPVTSKKRSSFQREDSLPDEPIMAVYIPNGNPFLSHEESKPIERYFINDDMYTISTKVGEIPSDKDKSDPSGLHVIGQPISVPAMNIGGSTFAQTSLVGQMQQGNYTQGVSVRPLSEQVNMLNGKHEKDFHHQNYKVIKSKRRPSWLQNAGQWLSKGKNKK